MIWASLERISTACPLILAAYASQYRRTPSLPVHPKLDRADREVTVTAKSGASSKTLFLFVGFLLVAVSALPAAAQNTIRVPADSLSIQGAINAANPRDTVLVGPGSYIENINFQGKAITVTSSGGAAVTTINGGANGSVVTFNHAEDANSVLHGFTITNGKKNGGFGGGISISGASPTITANIIAGNHAAVGLGIYVTGGSPLIQGNVITANNQTGAGSSYQGGGGIYVDGNSSTPGNAQIIGNTITNNSVSSGGIGGGISVMFVSSPLIENNLIQGNSAYNYGGGIALESSASPTVVQNLILNNSSGAGGSGGAMEVAPSSSAPTSVHTIANNTIASNTAFNSTAGIFVNGVGQRAVFTNNIIMASLTAVTCSSTSAPDFSNNDS
jgi:parallel beta-helix repeat protein